MQPHEERFERDAFSLGDDTNRTLWLVFHRADKSKFLSRLPREVSEEDALNSAVNDGLKSLWCVRLHVQESTQSLRIRHANTRDCTTACTPSHRNG